MKYLNLLFLVLFSCGVSPVIDPAVKLKSLDISDCTITFDADTHEYECVVTPGVDEVGVKANSEFLIYINGEKVAANTIKPLELAEDESDLKIKLETTITKVTSEYFVKLTKGKVAIDDFSFKVGDLELINNFDPSTHNYLINGNFVLIDYNISTNYKTLENDANYISLEVKNSSDEVKYTVQDLGSISGSFELEEEGTYTVTVKTSNDTYVTTIDGSSIRITELTITPDKFDPLSYFDPIDSSLSYNISTDDNFLSNVSIEFATLGGVNQAWYYNNIETTPVSIPMVDIANSFKTTISEVFFTKTYYIKIINTTTNKDFIYTLKFNKMDNSLVSLMSIEVLRPTVGSVPLGPDFHNDTFYYNIAHTFANNHKKFLFTLVYDNTKTDINELEIFLNGTKLENSDIQMASPTDDFTMKDITINKSYDQLNNVFEFKFYGNNGEIAIYTFTINTSFENDFNMDNLLSELNIYSQSNPSTAIASYSSDSQLECTRTSQTDGTPEMYINIDCTINTNHYIVEFLGLTYETILTTHLKAFEGGVYFQYSNDNIDFDVDIDGSFSGGVSKVFLIKTIFDNRIQREFTITITHPAETGTVE